MIKTFDIKGRTLITGSGSKGHLLIDPREVIRFMGNENYIGSRVTVSESPFPDNYFIVEKLEKSDINYHTYQVTRRKFWFFKEHLKFEMCDSTLCAMLGLLTPPEKLYVKGY